MFTKIFTRARKLRPSRAAIRRGNIIVLAAFLMTATAGMLAFSIDSGYMLVVKSQLQAAADSAAMAGAMVMGSTQQSSITVAQTYGAYHKAGGKTVSLATADIEYGTWDSTAGTFTKTNSVSNALRVTAKRNNTTGGNGLFFGRIFGLSTFTTQAQAIAMGNPRDICFVVDLSGSMNRDTWTDYGATASYRSSGYTSIYSTMMQNIFTDFGFGSYPGTTQTLAQSLGSGITWSGSGSKGIYSSSGPLSGNSIPTAYRVKSSDSTSAAQTKAYKWLIDNQLATLMNKAKPTPNSSNAASYDYWSNYIADVNSNGGVLGYRTYVSWCLDGGRDQTVDNGGDYSQLSTSSPNTPYHTESTAGGTFSFPPREQPTHSERRSVIAGLQEIKLHNTTLSDPTEMDWVSIVTFDKIGSVKTLTALTSNYSSAMTAASKMQAVGYNGASTDTEDGLIAGYNLIKPASQGGTGRENTEKVVILLTDGVANLKSSSNTTISAYQSANPSSFNGNSNYYGTSDYNSDAALMQSNMMQGKGWYVYALALGLAADYDFMNRMARMGGTADDNGLAPTTSGDPSTYETEMTDLLDKIIDNPQVRLVK